MESRDTDKKLDTLSGGGNGFATPRVRVFSRFIASRSPWPEKMQFFVGFGYLFPRVSLGWHLLLLLLHHRLRGGRFTRMNLSLHSFDLCPLYRVRFTVNHRPARDPRHFYAAYRITFDRIFEFIFEPGVFPNIRINGFPKAVFARTYIRFREQFFFYLSYV